MNVTIDIPEDLNELTLEQYQEYLTIEEPTKEDALRIFLGLNNELINKLPKKQVDSLSNLVLNLFSETPKHVNTFDYNGIKWGFIPKLDEITYGEAIDANKYFSDWEEMHKAMAVLYRPITLKKRDKYLIEDYKGTIKYSETMKGMPLGVVMGAMVFFYDLASELLKAIPNYLMKEVGVDQIPSLQNGGSTTNYQPLPTEILDELRKSLNYPTTVV